MHRQQIMQLVGIGGLALLALGATLYAINSPSPTTTRTVLIAGAILVGAYIILNIRVIGPMFRKRSARYGANMVVMIVLFASIVVVIQALSSRHSYRVDLTRNKRFSLAPQTVNVLRGLGSDLELLGFFRQSDEGRAHAEDLFDQFAHESDRVRYELIDPDRSPTRTSEMGVTNYGTIVIQYDDKRELISKVTEEALTNGVLKVTRDLQKSICFIVGHGEKDPQNQEPAGYSIMTEEIEKQNYAVAQISLFDQPEIPENCHLLVIAGPKNDYFDSEITKITDYLSAGKNAVFLIDPRALLPNLENLLLRYRVILDDNIVVDPYSRIFGTEYTVPVVTQYVEHPITDNIDVATFYPMARSVQIAPADIPGVSAQYLAQTGNSAWGETDLEGIKGGQAVRGDDDLSGPVSIALISEKKYTDGQPDPVGPDQSKIVVFGDSDFADNSAFRVSGNGDLFLNVVNYLAEEEDLIAIRPKEGLGDRMFLTAAQGRLVFFISVIALPLSVLALGVSVFAHRRKTG